MFEIDSKSQNRTRMTRIARIFTDTSYPRVSASSAQSAFYQICCSLKNPAARTKVSAFIRVHLRFFNTLIFQTGSTGLTGYVFYFASSEILRKLGRRRTDIVSIKNLENQVPPFPIQHKSTNLRRTSDLLLSKLILDALNVETLNINTRSYII